MKKIKNTQVEEDIIRRGTAVVRLSRDPDMEFLSKRLELMKDSLYYSEFLLDNARKYTENGSYDLGAVNWRIATRKFKRAEKEYALVLNREGFNVGHLRNQYNCNGNLIFFCFPNFLTKQFEDSCREAYKGYLKSHEEEKKARHKAAKEKVLEKIGPVKRLMARVALANRYNIKVTKRKN